MNKEVMSQEELNFLVRRNKEMEVAQMMTDKVKSEIQKVLKASLKSVEEYIKSTLQKNVDIDLLKYELINGRQSLAIIFEDELCVGEFNTINYSGKHYLFVSKTQFQHFIEHILNEMEEDSLLGSLNRGLNVLYQSLGQQINLDEEIKVDNISLSTWRTEDEPTSVDLDILYEAKRYAIEYADQVLFIIHLTEVEFMEKLYDHFSDGQLEQQSTTEVNQQNESKLSEIKSSQSNVEVRRPLFCAFDDVQTPNANHNLGLLYDVPLEITVVLGKTKRSIQEILEINTGKIIELNKYADDPLEIYCNGKLIAEGEVVVVDDNFGIKVTKLHQVAMNKIK